jgi:hypothetical protein
LHSSPRLLTDLSIWYRAPITAPSWRTRVINITLSIVHPCSIFEIQDVSEAGPTPVIRCTWKVNCDQFTVLPANTFKIGNYLHVGL